MINRAIASPQALREKFSDVSECKELKDLEKIRLMIDSETDEVEQNKSLQKYHIERNKFITIYKKMYKVAESAGFILADLKLEFGKLGNEILLGDSIGPDEYRMWPTETYQTGKTQESFDKQLLRDWLAECGYQKQFEEDRKTGKEPIAPSLPPELCQQLSSRYITAYKKITGHSL